MLERFIIPLVFSGLLAAGPAFGESQDMLIEIYRIVPGKHAEFLRHIALLDQANAEATRAQFAAKSADTALRRAEAAWQQAKATLDDAQRQLDAAMDRKRAADVARDEARKAAQSTRQAAARAERLRDQAERALRVPHPRPDQRDAQQCERQGAAISSATVIIATAPVKTSPAMLPLSYR